MSVERLTIPDVRIDKNTIRRSIIDAEKVKECAMEIYWRLKEIEDVIADEESEEYDLDQLRELVEADRDGRCVVLTMESKTNETIRDLVKIVEWIVGSVKKHDFSPFRIVAGAPENTFPVVREYQNVIDKHEEEIYLAFKDEEIKNALKGEQDG